jgi:hypothetical protein
MNAFANPEALVDFRRARGQDQVSTTQGIQSIIPICRTNIHRLRDE